MSTYVDVYLDGIFVVGLRNVPDLSFLGLFARDDIQVVRRDRTERRHLHESDSDYTPEVFASTEVIRDRLRVLGVDAALVRREFERAVEDREETLARIMASLERAGEEVRQHLERERAALPTRYSAWQSELRRRFELQTSAHVEMTDDGVAETFGIWSGADPSHIISSVVDALPDGELLLDLTELVTEWNEEWNPDPDQLRVTTEALLRFGEPVSLPIVVAEGPSDVLVLKSAMRVLFPHLEGYVRFFDFDLDAEGGASKLAGLIKSFAAAGVASRVLAVFDNDTAGTEQVDLLRRFDLPRNFGVTQLPSLPLARSYPTLGPAGSVDMDVNGLAASIELYFGEDVLRLETGDLAPVQWLGFNKRLERFQGAVVGRASLLRAFQSKVAAALRDPTVTDDQDWNGMRLVLQHILEGLSGTTGSSPEQSRS